MKTIKKQNEYRSTWQKPVVTPDKIEMTLLLKPEKELDPTLGLMALERQLLGEEVGMADELSHH